MESSQISRSSNMLSLRTHAQSKSELFQLHCLEFNQGSTIPNCWQAFCPRYFEAVEALGVLQEQERGGIAPMSF